MSGTALAAGFAGEIDQKEPVASAMPLKEFDVAETRIDRVNSLGVRSMGDRMRD